MFCPRTPPHLSWPLHVFVLLCCPACLRPLSPCLPRKRGPGCATPFLGSGGTPWPKFEGRPSGGPVPRSSEAWLGLVVGGWPLRPLESCLGKSELWPGVESSPRLVYAAEVQGGACAHPLWARGCRAWGPGRGLVSSGLREGGALASWAWAWRRRTTPLPSRCPAAFSVLPPGPVLSCPLPGPCVGPVPLEAPGSATSPGGGLSNVVPRVLTRPESWLVPCAVVWTEAFAVKCSVSYNPVPPSA